MISDIRQKDEIGWLTGDHSYFQVTITAEIYDTQTGAKLLDKTYLHEVEVDVGQATESEKETEYFDIIAIEKVLKRIVKEMHADICETVSNIPWLGFHHCRRRRHRHISAGKKVGLKAGNAFKYLSKRPDHDRRLWQPIQDTRSPNRGTQAGFGVGQPIKGHSGGRNRSGAGEFGELEIKVQNPFN